jgi:hypothetical protein
MTVSSSRPACTCNHRGRRYPCPHLHHFLDHCLVFSLQFFVSLVLVQRFLLLVSPPFPGMSESSLKLCLRSMIFRPSIFAYRLLAHPKRKQTQILLTASLFPKVYAVLAVEAQAGMLRKV